MGRRKGARCSPRELLSPLPTALAAALCVLGFTAATAVAAPSPEAGAAVLGAAPGSQLIELALPLYADQQGLEQFALAVSTKGSPQYGEYEPIAELASRFGASTLTRGRVLAYLKRVGASDVKIDATGLFADATMSVGLAERLFGAPLARFRAAHNVRFLAPTAAARMPAGLRGLATAVIGLDTQPLSAASPPLIDAGWVHQGARSAQANQPSGYKPRTGTASGCPNAVASGGFTPNQYLTAYDYLPLRLAGYAGQGERVALIEIDGFRYTDILSFARCFKLPVPGINSFGVGVAKPLSPGGESTLDLEVLDAAAPGLKAIDVYESRNRAVDLIRALTAPLQGSGSKPQVISASLGVCEPGLLQAVGTHGIALAEGSLAMAAASGITFLSSTGDSGSSACQGAVGPLALTAVNYPASSWWVTGVGGTNLGLTPGNQIVTQPVWNDAPLQLGAGGGGLSVLRRPSYQKAVVHTDHRSVPDVSMLADVAPGYVIYCSAKGDCINSHHSSPWVTVGGTSASSPLLAGGLALVDQYLRFHGLQGLGLANPLLYAIGTSKLASEVLYDVTTGNNDLGPYLPDGNHQPLGCCSAAPGYDDASGWGSIDLAHFAQVAAAVEPKIAAVTLSLPSGQRPVARNQLAATVSCSRGCLMTAVAEVQIGNGKPFAVDANVYLLRNRGHKTIAIKFSTRQLNRLRAALSQNRSIAATIVGEVVDPAGNVERRTLGRRLTIRA
ncbi:MAG: S8/S53 family peptidase [Solirubrobacterales bacterium]|nr:S8/S53 family peptidase [Solirubrobacterales bacterium]